MYHMQKAGNLKYTLPVLYKNLTTHCSFCFLCFLQIMMTFFYDLGLFILAGSISELYLHAMTAVLMGASLCSEFFTSINSKNDASPWVKSIS